MKLIFFVVLATILNGYYCLAKSQPSYQELQIELINKLPYITLEVENKPVKILFDTGARNKQLVIDKEIISKLNSLIKFPTKFKSTDITGKAYLANKYILPKFNIGDIEFLQIEVEEDTNWGLSSTDNKDLSQKNGVIGLALFQNKAIIINYPQNKLIVIDKKYPQEYDFDNWQALTYKIDRYGVSIYAAIDSSPPKRFILDSGSNISVIKPNAIGDNKAITNCKLTLQPGMQCTHIESKKFTINKINYQNIYFYIYNFLEPIADGILGYDFLADKAIYIDFDKREMKIKMADS